ncbi:MAG: bifunctional phosphoglucose/phosphomannose isomerase [Chloroflexota bacterium]
MNLDNFSHFKDLDPQDMLAHVDGLPGQLESAWDLGQRLPLPAWEGIQRVVIAGMGGSAIGADLVAAAVMEACPAPVIVHRDYGLPGFASGPGTLVVCSSHSGNTEETLDSFEQALERGCRILALCTGGKLAEHAAAAGAPVWQFDHKGQPRTAVGFSFGLLLGALGRLGLGPDAGAEVAEAVAAMRSQQEAIRADAPVVQNPAKRMAGQLMGRWVTVFGAGVLAPVARRWKGQVNEIAKAGANFEFIPEADHNTLAGLVNPEDTLAAHTMTLFLRAPCDHPRNRLRLDMTRQAYMLEGLNVDGYTAQGNSPIANIWTALHFGDYVAYYLAMAYEVDPTPVNALENFKKALKDG